MIEAPIRRSISRPVFPFPQAGEQFTALIPTAGEQVRIEGAAHFLQEENPTAVLSALTSFLG